MNAAIYIILGFLLLALYLGIQSKKGKKMDLEEWAVGGRSFGTVFVFLLMAGEAYTTFTFLGASSWAYDKGGPSLYILAYLSLYYVIMYWLYPAVWKYGKEHKLVSQSDFFSKKFNSPYLGVLASVIAVVSMIPYIVLQLKGLGLIVSVASYGAISSTLAIWIGAIVVTIYVMISGIHGSAWTAVIKDIMIFGIVLFIGIYIPIHYYGGIGDMFRTVQEAKPGFLVLPDKGLSLSWFISTVIVTVLGSFTWPHIFAASYAAKSAKTIRKNAIINPLYTLMILFIFFVGTAAILQVPNLDNPDLTLLTMSKNTFDPWFVGLIGSAGLLTALVPGSMLLINSSTSLSRNVYKVLFPKTTDKQISNLSKILIPIIALVCVYFTLNGGQGIVVLLLLAYDFIAQLLPPVVFSFMKKGIVTKYGAAAGMIVGVLLVAIINLTGTTMGSLFPFLPQVMKDLSIGMIALILNIAVMLLVSLLTKNLAASSNVKGETQST
ncbi:SSS family solute:Na+ symporter [Scopulibacillus darangshiensis]|uniref:SSS family solute:Na+ symporter n=1 Tax=Scopulibacillus darangshiensis TaxID=442528 RepID=A0A4R2PAE3_9BACL|nr:sodium:solute symporter [Scopulibacillus darangshiensis]TCP30865.1 SSS family solute:Na+ symporter [Scopulibacillus darangshiensis]